jgi:hypothetical protein
MSRTSSPLLWLGGLVLACVVVCAASPAAAKPPRTKQAAASATQEKPQRRRGKRERADKQAQPEAAAAPEVPTARAPDSRADAQRRAAQDAALGADAQVVREGETQVKVMSFEGLDIEGRLKSPQLLYFVGRVHAEFDRPTLPHRSFMPELESSTHTAPVQ